MSTKIYNGYRIKLDDTSVSGLMKWTCEIVKPAIEKTINEKILQMFNSFTPVQ